MKAEELVAALRAAEALLAEADRTLFDVRNALTNPATGAPLEELPSLLATVQVLEALGGLNTGESCACALCKAGRAEGKRIVDELAERMRASAAGGSP